MKTSDSLIRPFLHFVVPQVVGMMGMSAYIFSDTFFIAHFVGSDGLAALSFSLVIYTVLSALGVLLSIGAATAFRVRLSCEDRLGASQVCRSALLLMGVVALVLMIVVEVGADVFTSLLGADQTTRPQAAQYIRTLFWFTPLFFLSSLLIAFVRNDGAPRLAMVAMLVGNGASMAGDALLIGGCGWGLFGAACATAFYPLVSLSILAVYMVRHPGRFALVSLYYKKGAGFVKGARLSVGSALRIARHVVALGLSSGVMELSGGLVLMVFNLIIVSLAGNTGVAAYGIVGSFAMVVTAVFSGMGQGIQPLASSAYARFQHQDARALLRLSLGVALGVAVVVYGSVYLFAHPLVLAFNKEGDPALTNLAVEGVHLYFLGYMAAGINTVAAAFLSAVEKPRQGFGIALLRGFVATLTFALVGSALWGMKGVWLAFPLAEGVSLVYTLVCVVRLSYTLRPRFNFASEGTSIQREAHL